MNEETPLTPFPFALTPWFAEQLGYRGDRRFVAVYWEPLGDGVTVQDDRCSATGFGDRYLWSDLIGQRQVRTWLWKRNINLGNSDEVATHWLIINRLSGRGIITTRQHGCRIVQQQRLTPLE